MKQWEAGWQAFVDMCINIQDERALAEMFNLFLTAEEKVDIARRFLIVKELVKGEKTQRDIAKFLDVSIAKITRGSNELKRLDKKWLSYLDKVYRKEPLK